MHLQTNIQAKPQRNQGVEIFTEREGLMQQCSSQSVPLHECKFSGPSPFSFSKTFLTEQQEAQSKL